MWQQTVKQVEWSPDGLIPASQVQSLLNLQAEISYKAGYKKASDESNAISHLDCYEDGKKAGMKEVVEWMDEWCPHRDNDFPCPDNVPDELRLHKRDCPDCWQAFLKEIET